MKKVQFFSRPNCTLCEEGLLMLKLVKEDIDFEIEVINIEHNDELHEKYMLMIPVVVYNENVVQYGNIDYPTMYEMLRNE